MQTYIQNLPHCRCGAARWELWERGSGSAGSAERLMLYSGHLPPLLPSAPLERVWMMTQAGGGKHIR